MVTAWSWKPISLWVRDDTSRAVGNSAPVAETRGASTPRRVDTKKCVTIWFEVLTRVLIKLIWWKECTYRLGSWVGGIHLSSHFFYYSTKKKVHLCDEKSVTIVSPPAHKRKKTLWRYELSLLCQGNSQLILDKTERQLSHKRLHITSHGLTILIFILVDGNVREYYCWILSFLVQFWVNFKIILRTKADSLSFP